MNKCDTVKDAVISASNHKAGIPEQNEERTMQQRKNKQNEEDTNANALCTDERPEESIDELFILVPIWPLRPYKSRASDCDCN